MEAERLAAKDIEKVKTMRAQAEEAAAEARMKELDKKVVLLRDRLAMQQQAKFQKAYERWLQTVYPALVAERCIAIANALSPKAKDGYKRECKRMLAMGLCDRPVFCPDLWETNVEFTHQWSQIKAFIGGAVRSVRCGLNFETLIDKHASPALHGRDTVAMLYCLLSACVPSARKMFVNSFSPLRLLHMNDYVIEKTFVYAIVALSKWFGEDRFPPGIYGAWPPAPPNDLMRTPPAPSQVDLTTPSDLPLAPPPGASIPPHLRIGEAARGSAD